MALLDALHVSHTFDYPLFNDISFSLDHGESMSIVGVSGCGKSTLLHICATLLSPDEGDVIFNGESLYNTKSKDFLDIRRNEMGIIFQSHYLFKGFDARENIELSTLLAGTTFDDALVERLGIEHILSQKVGELSGGQQQRVSIARVLSKKPRIIFADEPTGNLDQETAREVMDVLFDYVKDNEAALMLVSHDETLAHECDKTYKLENLSLKQV